MVRNTVQQLIDALQAFFHHLAAVSWAALSIAVALQVLRLGARSVAWRSILAAAYGPGFETPAGAASGPTCARMSRTRARPASAFGP
jgi:hypothetical protein